MLAVRPFEVADSAAVLALDTSFDARSILTVERRDSGVALTETLLAAPITKRFPLEDLESPDRPWSHAWVADAGDVVAGFAAVAFEPWNARLTLWHLYVDPPFRRQGVAGRLLAVVAEHARSVAARHIWLETSSLNAPGVAAYRRLGFQLTGVDLMLYDGTPAEGEVALFFSKLVTG